MSLVIPPGFAQASIVLTGPLGTAPYVTTIGLDVSEAGGDFVGVANLVFDAYANAFLSTTNDALTLSKVTLLVGQDGGNGSVDSTLAARQGGNGSDMAPIAMAPIVRKQSADLGRKGRGRMFLPGALGDGDVNDNGQLLASFRNGVDDACAEMLEELAEGVVPGLTEATPSPAVILHNEGIDADPYPIIALTCATTVGWIRKRLR